MKILIISLIMTVLTESKPTSRPLEIRVEPAMQTVMEGTGAQLDCIISDPDPSFQVRWLKDGIEWLGLHAETIGRTLQIPDIEASNAGEYVCQVKDNGTWHRAVAWIKTRPRGIPVLEVYPRDKVIVPWLHSVTLVCRTSADYPNLTVKWRRKDGRPFTQNIVPSVNGSLTITRIEILNEGDYECTSTNKVGTGSAIVKINVVIPPTLRISPSYNNEGIIFVKSGERVRLFCDSDGYPEPLMILRKFIPQSGAFQIIAAAYDYSFYDITSMSEKDVQNYSCEGQNPGGSQTIIFRVEMKKEKFHV